MNVTETTSTSWFSRIGGALTGAIFGVIIVIAAIVAYLFTPLYNRLRAKINGGTLWC